MGTNAGQGQRALHVKEDYLTDPPGFFGLFGLLSFGATPGRGGNPVCWVSMRPCVTGELRSPCAVLFLRRALV